MAVKRDPETGEFTSGGGVDWADTRTIVGTVYTEIPAADLSGGTIDEEVQGDPGLELVDWDGIIVQENEVVEVVDAMFMAHVSAHTTATAEGFVGVGFEVKTDNSIDQQGLEPPFFGGGGDLNSASGIVDGNNSTQRLEGNVFTGYLAGEPSHSDTTNTLAGGAEYAQLHQWYPYREVYDQGPMYDMDDSWFVPHEFHVDNISDHAVQFGIVCQAQALVHEV